MKRILVPVDFTKDASSGIYYAIKIAEKLGSKIILFHVSHIPLAIPDAPYSYYESALDNGEKIAKEKLESIRDEWINKLSLRNKIEIEIQVNLGFVVEEINQEIDRQNIDLVIMSSKGAKGMGKVFFGSNTERVIKTSNCAVLLIPSAFEYKEFKNIVLATDYKNMNTEMLLQPLSDLAEAYQSNITIFNVKPEKEYVATFDEAIVGLEIEKKISKSPHQYVFSEKTNVLEALEDFLKGKKPDLLVLVPHQHGFIDQVFSKSITSEMALEASLPILSLPDLLI
jgi:nucleotide-binding universal stress UspA family protein